MRPVKYNTEGLINEFKKKIVLTMDDIKKALGTNIKMTILRILKKIIYRSSYSHSCQYYILNNMAKYNKYGIWTYNDIYFSKSGSLSNTIINLINTSPSGYTAKELEMMVHISSYNILLKLFLREKVKRIKIDNEYVYTSFTKSAEQIIQRHNKIKDLKEQTSSYQLNEYMNIFIQILTERQQRLFAGWESLRIGYGGDEIISKTTGINVKTVAKGREELITKNINIEKIREIGAGRPSLKKTKKF